MPQVPDLKIHDTAGAEQIFEDLQIAIYFGREGKRSSDLDEQAHGVLELKGRGTGTGLPSPWRSIRCSPVKFLRGGTRMVRGGGGL